nr:MAG TPA: hypothetical protein [Caudoviricetes sp.]
MILQVEKEIKMVDTFMLLKNIEEMIISIIKTLL